MQTVKPGTLPPVELAWWINKECSCHKCKGVFRLETTDFNSLTIYAERHPDGVQTVSFVCPTPNCNAVVIRHK